MTNVKPSSEQKLDLMLNMVKRERKIKAPEYNDPTREFVKSVYNLFYHDCIKHFPELMDYQIGSRFKYDPGKYYYNETHFITKTTYEDEKKIIASTFDCNTGELLKDKIFYKENIVENYGKTMMKWDIEALLKIRLHGGTPNMEGWNNDYNLHYQSAFCIMNLLNDYYANCPDFYLDNMSH